MIINEGDALRMLERYEESILLYDKALQNDSNYVYALYGKGT